MQLVLSWTYEEILVAVEARIRDRLLLTAYKPENPEVDETNYRRCISCNRIGLKSEFWQIVRVNCSGQLQLDRGMGRSAYICPQADCLQLAQKSP